MKQALDSSPSLPIDPDLMVIGVPQKQSYWRKIGGGSLFISLVIHGILVIIAIVAIVGIIPPPPEKTVDFTAGGGGGGQPAGGIKSQQKKQANFVKATTSRVAAQGVSGGFSLPEPDSAGGLSALGALGGMGSGGMGGGSGGAGAGGGSGGGEGNGMGLGVGMSGGKGLMVFGTALNVRSIGVVMDVSGSMTRHLPKVLEELDRVAKGSPVVLHVGCGIGSDRTRPNIESTIGAMRGGDATPFKEFWYLYQDPFYRDVKKDGRAKIDFSRTLPLPQIYEEFAKRPNTYYNNPEGPKSTADAILAKAFDNVEAIYWFADFQDRIDEGEAEKLAKALKRKKQKLYMHASAQGANIDIARNLICLPTGGKEILPSTDSQKKDK